MASRVRQLRIDHLQQGFALNDGKHLTIIADASPFSCKLRSWVAAFLRPPGRGEDGKRETYMNRAYATHEAEGMGSHQTGSTGASA